MEKVDYAGLGRRIRYFRKRRGLTQEELANLGELTQKHISNIECAHSIPTLQTFVKISNCLQVPPDLLLGDSLAFSYPGRAEEVASLIRSCSRRQLAEVEQYIFYILQK